MPVRRRRPRRRAASLSLSLSPLSSVACMRCWVGRPLAPISPPDFPSLSVSLSLSTLYSLAFLTLQFTTFLILCSFQQQPVVCISTACCNRPIIVYAYAPSYRRARASILFYFLYCYMWCQLPCCDVSRNLASHIGVVRFTESVLRIRLLLPILFIFSSVLECIRSEIW